VSVGFNISPDAVSFYRSVSFTFLGCAFSQENGCDG